MSAKTTATLNDLIETAKTFKEAKHDYHVPMSAVRLGGTSDPAAIRDMFYDNRPTLLGIAPHRPITLTSAKQMAQLLGLSSAQRMIENDLLPNGPGLFGDIVNHFSEVVGYGLTANTQVDKNVLVREIDPIEGYYNETIVRAFKGSRYTPMDAYAVLTVLNKVMEGIDRNNLIDRMLPILREQYGDDVTVDWANDGGSVGEIMDYRLTPDDFDVTYALNVKVTPTHGPEAGNGFRPTVNLKSDDIRGMALHCMPGVWRLVCANGMRRYFGRKERSDMNWAPAIYHNASAEKMLAELIHSIQQSIVVGGDLVKQVYQASIHQLMQPEVLLENLITGIVPKEQRDAALMQAGLGTEGRRDIMAVINGLTFAAHQAGLDPDTRYMLETVGGTVLSNLRDVDLDGDIDATINNLFASVARIDFLEVESD